PFALLQGALDRLDLKALDDVALLDVLIIGEGHAAFLADDHFAGIVLETLEGGQFAFVDDDVVANEANFRTASHDTFGDAATGDLARFGDVEDFENFRVTEEFLARLRR